MKRSLIEKRIFFGLMALSMAVLPLAAAGQTAVSMPKNKYKVQDDIKLGRDAAAKVDQQFPILNDQQAEDYVTRVGERLVAAIPAQFQQPAFDYQFKVVNASDINAFALPGGPMYVNRGMIEAAKNEGEMAGVMAHEISHVALRHATAQQTKVNNPLNQILGIGAILGGAVLGGEAGAQAGQIVAAGYFLRYSREYETQADTLGAQIMARAGYDPRDLANMFQTIQQQSRGGGGSPEWLSSHPDPGNRFQKINREASLLLVSPNPIKVTRDFSRTQERLRGMSRAPSMAEIERGGYGSNSQGQSRSQNPTSGGRYASSVPYPSTRVRSYSSGNWIRMSVPNNWREFAGQSEVTFAPEGGYGDQGITHGAMIGVVQSGSNDLDDATRAYVDQLLSGNSYLRQRGSSIRTSVAGRQAYTTQLSGRSPITNQNEIVTVYSTMLRNGDLVYIAAVSPENDSPEYSRAFRAMINSIRFND
ncbi:MAG: M48 family metallopeptidase [Acidobacteriota bacterium]